jgi:type VI secretion system secreted protein Hcp
MTDVIVTSVAPSMDSGAVSLEGVALQFARVDLEYKPQKADGSLEPGIHFTYDIKANKPG